MLMANDTGSAMVNLPSGFARNKCAGRASNPYRNQATVAFFEVLLDKPLAAPPGTPLHLTFTHRGGSKPMALAVSPGANQQLRGPDGALPDRRLHLAFKDSMPMRGFHKAYADSMMDIWEVPEPAPYYEVVQGGPCTLATEKREDLTATCSSPAKVAAQRTLYAWVEREE